MLIGYKLVLITPLMNLPHSLEGQRGKKVENGRKWSDLAITRVLQEVKGLWNLPSAL